MKASQAIFLGLLLIGNHLHGELIKINLGNTEHAEPMRITMVTKVWTFKPFNQIQEADEFLDSLPSTANAQIFYAYVETETEKRDRKKQEEAMRLREEAGRLAGFNFVENWGKVPIMRWVVHYLIEK